MAKTVSVRRCKQKSWAFLKDWFLSKKGDRTMVVRTKEGNAKTVAFYEKGEPVYSDYYTKKRPPRVRKTDELERLFK